MFMPWYYKPYTGHEPKTHREVMCGINAQYLSFRINQTTCPWCLQIVDYLQELGHVTVKGDSSLDYKIKSPVVIHLAYMPKSSIWIDEIACGAEPYPLFAFKSTKKIKQVNCENCRIYLDKLIEDDAISIDRYGEVR